MGFSMGGYVAAAFAATHPDLVAGVVMGACAHDTHTTTWKLVGYMSQAVYAVCSPRTKSQVSSLGTATLQTTLQCSCPTYKLYQPSYRA